ncbi:hypothetical protein BH10BAC2_BH10BAC2_42830 [soil metagenome]
MKKIILTATLFIALCTAAIAGGNNKQLINDLGNALKSSRQVQWSSNETHNRAAFGFNGQTVVAYYDREDEQLVGYSIHLTAADLPKKSQDAIEKKYAGWQITETIMFIDKDGYSSHFVKVTKDKKDLALKVNDDKVYIYRRMF